ncbi:MAG: hypothetical protein WBP43_03995, partial [Chitinophagales bacterium]
MGSRNNYLKAEILVLNKKRKIIMKKILLLLLFTPLFFSTTEAQIGAVTPHRFDVLNYELHLDLYDNFLPPYPSLYYATEIITLEVDSTLSALVFDAKKS